MGVGHAYSVIDISFYDMDSEHIEEGNSLKLSFIKYFRDNHPFIGMLPIVGDIIPVDGGKVW